ncbi:FDF domain-containing protein [Dichotomocladium elegans]|nr:FDF domain-containing protein [Dichotomocladium elegans]
MYAEKRNVRHPQQNSNNSISNKSNGRRNSKAAKKSAMTLPEFDFASANAKFNKEQVLRNLLTNGKSSEQTIRNKKDELVLIPEAETYYDKKKSFFDDISCDAKERAEAKKTKNDDYRKKQQEEKKLNLETFGQASVEATGRNHTRVGGGGRGDRGRGGGGHAQGRTSRSNGKRNQSTRA